MFLTAHVRSSHYGHALRETTDELGDDTTTPCDLAHIQYVMNMSHTVLMNVPVLKQKGLLGEEC